MLITAVTVVVDHPWAFGWTAIAGLFTAVLAVGTVALARTTSRDVRGRQRPVVWPTGDAVVRSRPDPTGLGLGLEVEIRLGNIGGGPALRVIVNANVVYPNGSTSKNGFLASIPPGAPAPFRIPLEGSVEDFVGARKIESGVIVNVRYRDLGGRDYRAELRYCDAWSGTVLDQAPTEPVELSFPQADARFVEVKAWGRWKLWHKRWKARKTRIDLPDTPEQQAMRHRRRSRLAVDETWLTRLGGG